MDASAMTKVSAAVALLGLFALLIISFFIEPEEVSISGIGNTSAEDVVIKGRITGLRNYGGFIVAEVSEVKSVDVILFDKRMAAFGVGSNVTIAGRLRDYRGKKELVADSVRVTS